MPHDRVSAYLPKVISHQSPPPKSFAPQMLLANSLNASWDAPCLYLLTCPPCTKMAFTSLLPLFNCDQSFRSHLKCLRSPRNPPYLTPTVSEWDPWRDLGLSFLYSFIQEIVIECLLWSRHRASCWDYSNEPNRHCPGLQGDSSQAGGRQ